jgi:succinoglycan biosynthesis transport protein ExoP
MEPQNKKRRVDSGSSNYGYRPGSYGYGSYGVYASGYATTGAANIGIQRTFQDYLLVARERIWYIVLMFVVIVGIDTAFTFTRVPQYRSTASIEVFRRNPMIMPGQQQVMDSEVRTLEDVNTQLNILKSDTIVLAVARQLTGEDLNRFLAPYRKPDQPLPRIEQILTLNRDVSPERLSLLMDVSYVHPDREIAAKVANLFASEYIAYNAHTSVEQSMKAVEELEQRANDQRKKVDGIAAALQAYREKNNLVSLDQRKDIVTEKLKELNGFVTKSSAALQEAETRWKQVLACRQSGGDFLDLEFIASTPAVSQLQQQVATQKINVAQLSKRYRSKHPAMQQAQNSLNQAESELKRAIDTGTAQVETEYQTATQNYGKAEAALAAQENDSLKLDRFGLEYTNLERDYDVNERILEQMLERTQETTKANSIENQSARIVDLAAPAERPVSPRYTLYLALGVVFGAGFGVALALFIAHTDDRVKSAFDIESVIGLPLIGIVPKVKDGAPAAEGASAIGSLENRDANEAFASLLSALRLKDQSKSAQCLLITSTVASEGKTFIISHLAATYADHGERVLVVDCDLRRPALNRIFKLENQRGVIDVCTSGFSLDEAIVKHVKPNLDVLPTGGRSKNPTQTLNSKEFAAMITELRRRYDRIFIDTPPVGIVTDSLIVLPLVDGWIYSIYFNKVRRKAAEVAVKRMLEVNVPGFGAVLNGLTGALGGYYYSHYYDKSYKEYYVTRAEELGGSGAKIAEPTQRPPR